MMRSPTELMQQIMDDPDSPTASDLALTLLKEFRKGFPLDNLRQMIAAPEEGTAKIGAFIASELGRGAKPLLSSVVPFLRHPNKRVRADLTDVVLVNAGPGDGKALMAVLPLLEDTEPGVRWKAMGFFHRTTKAQLDGALAALEPSSVYHHGISWLLSPGGTESSQVEQTLAHSDPLLRKFGVIGAARMAAHDPSPLRVASKSTDPDVQDFADSVLEGMEGN